MVKIADKYFKTDPWKIIEAGFNPEYLRVSESVFALSNENLGVRGNFDEGGSFLSLRGMYVNGVYEIEDLPRSYKGIVDKTHFMIPAVDWLKTSITVDGEVLDLGKSNFSAFVRELDMRSGTLSREFVWHTNSGKNLKLKFIRFLDMNHGERAYSRICFEALDFSGPVLLSSGLSFDLLHEGRNECFFENAQIAKRGPAAFIKARTKRSGMEVFAAMELSGALVDKTDKTDRSVTFSASLDLVKGEALNVDKRVTVLFDRTEGEELWKNGSKAFLAAKKISFDEALKAQQIYWEEFFKVSDIVIEPSCEEIAAAVLEEQQGIRFCNFQMAQTYHGGSVHHNIGAKGLTGEAYNGHAFWDTEACCLPFYLFSNPQVAKSLLIFRYNTLPQARERAEMLDCRGACYPIATLNGEEACNLWQHASLQFHPSTAVAYGIWHYVKITGDKEFLYDYGAEMLLEIARFLITRVDASPITGDYGFYGVMGLDEFQLMVNNNAYTNYMSKRSLEYALSVINDMIAERPEQYKKMAAKTDFYEAETAKWQDVAANMYMPVTAEGLFEQHDGFFELPHMEIDLIPVDEFPLYNHWSYDRIYRNNMIKQPDVLMFLYLYNSSFSAEVKRLNYEFYEPLTVHESSLSPAIHSILAAELGKMEEATDFFGYATRLDLDNYNRNTGEGLHTTSIALAWINIVYGFAGLRSDADLLQFAPRLPERWKRLSFSITYQGRIVEIEMEKEKTRFSLRKGKALLFVVYGEEVILGAEGLVVTNW
ncbi:MAG: family 65 glycosyl hydrolase [Lachnospiraceae bacterium]|nr:family 65 glycosyl hydrolase [Lachnospiraceae bacterium]